MFLAQKYSECYISGTEAREPIEGRHSYTFRQTMLSRE